MRGEGLNRAVKTVQEYTGGAVGAGLALVVLPCTALYFGIDRMFEMPTVGLPILAIFGIMILFGALALISTLFARLDLSDSTQAFGLPEGSIRAAIALSLIVLFSIISIMLYQTLDKPYVIGNLTDDERATLVKDPALHVIAVLPQRCPPAGTAGAAADCPAGTLRYAVHVRQPAAQESTDLAKQLLILIGTLMTSVTSFYFASRATEAARDVDRGAGSKGGPMKDGLPSGRSPPGATAAEGAGDATRRAGLMSADGDSHVDGCDVEVADITRDEDLPPARGGVA
jgi:hypothetical protein